MCLSYKGFLHEKLGIISRVTQTSDIFQISEIINEFIEYIYNHSSTPYTKHVDILNERPISIKYEPNIQKIKLGIDGEFISNKDNIYIYKFITNKNYLYVKYTLIHELLHVVHDIYDNLRKNNPNPFDDIIYKLRIGLCKYHIYNKEVTHFAYLMYSEDLPEIRAIANNAYIMAYKYVLDNVNVTNKDVVSYVIKQLRLRTSDLNDAIDEIKNTEIGFVLVICILISHFYELTQNYIDGQKYFDSDIFRLPIVKKMRNEVADILNVADSEENICEKIYTMIDNNCDELLKYKDQILASFIVKLKYWYKKTMVQMGKAIILGINDATDFDIEES